MSGLTSILGGVSLLLAIGGCGKKSESKPAADPPAADRPVAAPTPAPAPTTGAISGEEYKMKVRLGDQTAPPVLAAPKEIDPPSDPAPIEDEAARDQVLEAQRAEQASKEAQQAEETRLKGEAARAAAAKAAAEAAKPR